MNGSALGPFTKLGGLTKPPQVPITAMYFHMFVSEHPILGLTCLRSTTNKCQLVSHLTLLLLLFTHLKLIGTAEILGGFNVLIEPMLWY